MSPPLVSGDTQKQCSLLPRPPRIARPLRWPWTRGTPGRLVVAAELRTTAPPVALAKTQSLPPVAVAVAAVVG